MKTNLKNAAVMLQALMASNVPTSLLGSPGLGKSDVVKSVANALNLKLIDFRLSTADPTDLSGLPFMEEGRSVFLPNRAFPLKTDKLPPHTDVDGNPIKLPVLDENGVHLTDPSTGGLAYTYPHYDGWLLFLDEITNAPMSVQAAAYKLILDRQVGEHDLHPTVKIVAAGNNMDDGAAVTGEMSTALKSRMAHINIEFSREAWFDWAMEAGVHHAITSFLKFMPGEMYRFDPKDASDTFPCPRTWAMVDRIVQTVGLGHPMLQDMISATISDGTATNFVNYTKHFTGLPTYEEIVKDPKGTHMPDNQSVLFALSGSVGAQTKADTIAAVMEYVDRMPREFQLRTFNDFTRRNPSLVGLPPVRAWLQKNSKDMIGA